MYDTAALAYVDKAEETPRQGLKGEEEVRRYVDGRGGRAGSGCGRPSMTPMRGRRKGSLGMVLAIREKKKKSDIFFNAVHVCSQKSHFLSLLRMQFIRCQIPRPMCSTHRSGMNMAPLLLSFAVSECVSPTPITSLSSFLAYTHSLPLRSIFRLLVPPRDNGGKERRGGRGILRAHLDKSTPPPCFKDSRFPPPRLRGGEGGRWPEC